MMNLREPSWVSEPSAHDRREFDGLEREMKRVYTNMSGMYAEPHQGERGELRERHEESTARARYEHTQENKKTPKESHRPSLHQLMSGASAYELLESDERSPVWETWERVLLKPTRDFLKAPGKSLRRDFVHLGWELAWLAHLGDDAPAQRELLEEMIPECPAELALLIELLHTGSLVIDDIEDQSEMRRGIPCLHQTIGVAPALNIGNWLYFVSGSMIERLDCDLSARAHLHSALNRVMLRCHQGQALDVSCQVTSVERAQIAALTEASTRLKTGVLVGFSLQISALYLGMTYEESAPLYAFGEDVGLGLQMYDDLSGLANPKRWHKGCEDLSRARLTWVWSWVSQNPELSTADFAFLIDELQALSNQPHAQVSDLMLDEEWLARAVALRDQCLWWVGGARGEVEAQIDHALLALAEKMESPLIAEVAQSAINRLKSSYL